MDILAERDEARSALINYGHDLTLAKLQHNESRDAFSLHTVEHVCNYLYFYTLLK